MTIIKDDCDEGHDNDGDMWSWRNSAGNLVSQESWISLILLAHVASRSRTAKQLRSFGAETTCHTLSGFSVNGWKQHRKQVHLFAVWGDRSPLTDQQERQKPTRTRTRTTSRTAAKPLNLCFFFRFAVLFGAEMVIKLIAFGLVTWRFFSYGSLSPLLLPIWTVWEREHDMMWCFTPQLRAFH